MAHGSTDFPALRERTLPRARIDALLDDAFKSNLVVVHAGPGFGKTTSVSHYLSRSNCTVVWFSASVADNTSVRFWDHLTRAIGLHRAELGTRMQELGFPDTAQKFSQFISDLTDVLYRDEKSAAFVFDDVSVLTDPVVLAFLEKLVAVRMENSNIVILTRIWPIFAGQLPLIPQVIYASQLKFAEEETAAYLEMVGVELSEETVHDIHNYLSGWPIALELIAYSIKHGSPHDIPDLSMSKPALFSLFEQQIFSQYAKSEQDLLIKLSSLDSFPRGLVHAATGEQALDLQQLLNSNIFIKYDSNTERLSFHPLYIEFLRGKLIYIDEKDLFETYEAAGDWCQTNGHYHDAVEYYQRCAAHQKLWTTLLKIDTTRRSHSEAEFFIDQINGLPELFKRENPMTKLIQAMMLANNLRFEESAYILDEVQGQIPKDDTSLLGEYYVTRGLLTLAREEPGFEHHFEKAAEFLPQGSSRWNNKFQLVDSGPALNLHDANEGGLEKSLASFKIATPFMVKAMNGAGQGIDHLCESEALFLTGEVKRAIDPAYEALYTATGASQYDIVGNALFILLRIYFMQGKYDMVLDTLEHVGRYEADKNAQTLGIWDIIRAWFYAEMGEIEKVATWIRNPIQKGFAPVSLDRPMVARLRCLINAGHFPEALALLNQLESLAQSKSAVISLIYAHLGRAVAYNGLGQYKEAAASLKTAYEFSHGNRISMPFIEYGNHARSLFEHVKRMEGHDLPDEWLVEMRSKASTYAKRLAYIIGRYRQEIDNRVIDYGLSPRETELLSNLSQGLTREEIAQAMNLSINTVKSLTKQTFTKLGAINAPDAVRIGIANNLI